MTRPELPTDAPRAACAIIRDPHGRVLSLRQRDGWVLPGGSIEPGETPRQAATRELFEETGVRVQLHPLPVHLTRSTAFYTAMFYDASGVRAGSEGAPSWVPWKALVDHPRYGVVAGRIAYKLGVRIR